MSSYKEERDKYLNKVLTLHRAGIPKGDILKEIPITRKKLDRWIEKYALKKKTTQQYYSSKRNQYYSEAIRLHFEEGYGEDKISKILPIGHTTASRWIANFVAENGIKATSIMKEDPKAKDASSTTSSNEVKELKAKIASLESQLKYQEMRAEAYDTMIDIAEKKFNIPVRKKSGAKQ